MLYLLRETPGNAEGIAQRPGSIILFRIVDRSLMDLDVPPGLIATRRRPGKRKVGACVCT